MGRKVTEGICCRFCCFPCSPSKFFTVAEQKPLRVTCNGVVLKFMQLGFRLDITSLILTGAS